MALVADIESRPPNQSGLLFLFWNFIEHSLEVCLLEPHEILIHLLDILVCCIAVCTHYHSVSNDLC